MLVTRIGRALLLALLCAVALVVAAPSLANAQESNGKVVRVGWYESPFNRLDEHRIATYTGWTYEYVEGSWSELYEMLAEGKIDLLSDVSYTEERAK